MFRIYAGITVEKGDDIIPYKLTNRSSEAPSDASSGTYRMHTKLRESL
jgi:hypothetical protein